MTAWMFVIHIVILGLNIIILLRLNKNFMTPLKYLMENRLVALEDNLSRTQANMHAVSHDLEVVMEKLEVIRLRQQFIKEK